MLDPEKWTFVDGPPAMPLKLAGECWHRGWDIPTRWAIDAAGFCWADAAHGPTLYKVGAPALLSMLETEQDGQSAKAHELLGAVASKPLNPHLRAARSYTDQAIAAMGERDFTEVRHCLGHIREALGKLT